MRQVRIERCGPLNVLESLLVGVFGLCVVFVVLVGLSLLLWLQSALAGQFSGLKKAGAQEVSDASGEPSIPEPEPPPSQGIPDDVSELIISPVPGTVLEVMVSVGDCVRRGSPLMLLGAMRMEYEINASTDGTVTQIFVSDGAAVEAGTPLIEIR
jgi:biotin carboxyl carrier protein